MNSINLTAGDSQYILMGNDGIKYTIQRDSEGKFGISVTGSSGTKFGNIFEIDLKQLKLGYTDSKLGFYGNSPVSKQAAPASASDLDTCITAVNSLITKLKNYGLLS